MTFDDDGEISFGQYPAHRAKRTNRTKVQACFARREQGAGADVLVIPKAPSETRTLPWAASGASAWFKSRARLRRCSFFVAWVSSLFGLIGGRRIGKLNCASAWPVETMAPGAVPGSLRNANTMESDITRYLPSLIEEIPYITTKKANSKVMKSA